MSGLKFADGQRRSADAARGNCGCDTRSVWEPGIEERLEFADFIPERASDVPYRNLEVFLREPGIGNLSQIAMPLDKDPPRSVHHDLGDVFIENQVLDGP